MVQSQTDSRSNTPASSTAVPGRSFTIVAFVLAFAALFFFPPVLGLAGAICGGIGYSKGDRLGLWALFASIAAAAAGMALAYAVLSN